MGESLCVMPAFSYDSGISNETNQRGNHPMHALGESVSFGRFTTESLAWEKWSSFSQKRHVEEAERLAQQGSVAEKKAFFEAHYKRIAAKKAAEAALLKQAEAAANATELEELEGNDSNYTSNDSEIVEIEDSQVDAAKQQEHNSTYVNEFTENTRPIELEIDKLEEEEAGVAKEPEVLVEIHTNVVVSLEQFENFNERSTVSGLESTTTPQMKKPLLKDISRSVSKKTPVFSSLRSSVFSKITSSPAKSIVTLNPRKENSFTPMMMRSTIEISDKKKSTPKSLGKLIRFTPAKQPSKLSTPSINKIESSRTIRSSYKDSKDFATPLRTPVVASVNGVPRHPSSRTPCPENKRCSKSISTCQKKLKTSALSTPFILRTELRAAKRKQKLEDRFNEKEEEKVQRHSKAKEKADTEVRKLRQTLCFSARPLPEFYRERKTSSKKQMNKEMHPHSSKLGGQPINSLIQETEHPLTKSSTKTNAFNNMLKKNNQTPSRSYTKLQARNPN